MPVSEAQKGLQATIRAVPDDPTFRGIFADCLEDDGEAGEGWLHRYLYHLTPDVLSRLSIFGRADKPLKLGPDWSRLPLETRLELRAQVREILDTDPQVHFILLGAMSLDVAGFSEVSLSTILYREIQGRPPCAVVPIQLSAEHKIAAAEFALRVQEGRD